MKSLSFRQRQLMILLAVGIIPLVVILAVALPIIRNSIIQRVAAQLEIVSDLKVAQVEQWLDQGKGAALLVASPHVHQWTSPVLQLLEDGKVSAETRAGLIAHLEFVRVIFPQARSISLLHPDTGVILASTDPTQEGRVRRDRRYFQEGKRDLYVSPVTYSVGQEAPVLNIAAPMRNEEGDGLLAVVVVEMDFDDLDATLDNRAGLGQTGRAYLVEADYGFYVTLPEGVGGSPLGVISKSEGVHHILEGLSGQGVYSDDAGDRVIGVYRRLPQANLGLLVEMEEWELFGQIAYAWVATCVLVLFVLALAVIAARYLNNWLVSPLEEIAGAARALQSGDLSRRVPAQGSDEIGQLASAFNEMADSLQEYYETLEHQVIRRTAELESTNAQLRWEIEERKRIEFQLVRAQKMESVGQLAGGVAHYFNNLLTSIIGYAELARSELSPDGAVWKDIGTAIASAEQAARIARQLSAFARQQIIRPEKVRLGDFVLQKKDMLASLLNGRIDFVVEPAPGGDWVEIDLHQMEEVLVILTENARDAMPDGGRFVIKTANVEIVDRSVFPEMTAGEFEPGPFVMMSVADSGMGIEDGVKNHLFEPFFTTKGFASGTGLGLATVYGAVGQHQGFIRALSGPDQGAIFEIYLPRVKN